MAQKKWDSTSIPDQKDRVSIITGSNTGIGYETARVLANKKATVIIAVRNLEKGNAAANQIRARHENANVKVMALDLANLKSVNNFAADFKNNYKRLDLLINNARCNVSTIFKNSRRIRNSIRHKSSRPFCINWASTRSIDEYRKLKNC